MLLVRDSRSWIPASAGMTASRRTQGWRQWNLRQLKDAYGGAVGARQLHQKALHGGELRTNGIGTVKFGRLSLSPALYSRSTAAAETII